MKKKVTNQDIIDFIARLQEKVNEHWTRHYSNLEIPTFVFHVGKKYVKLVHNGSVYCFIEIETGDILKAATFKKPALHARGNLFDDSQGMDCTGPHGIKYLIGPDIEW